jgi:hypothetical protein
MKKIVTVILSIISLGTIAIGGGFLFVGFWLEAVINRLNKKSHNY